MKKLYGVVLGVALVLTVSSCADNDFEYNFIVESNPNFSKVDWDGFTYEGWEEEFILPPSFDTEGAYSLVKWEFFPDEGFKEDNINELYEGISPDSKYYIKDSTISEPVVSSGIRFGATYIGYGGNVISAGNSVNFGVYVSYQGNDEYFINDQEFYDSFGFYQYQFPIVDSYYLDKIGLNGDENIEVWYIDVYNEYTFEIWEESIFKDEFVTSATMTESIAAYRIISVKDYNNVVGIN